MSDQDAAPKPAIQHKAATVLSAVFSWPAFAVLVTVLFWTPLHQIGALFPKILENSESITLGKLTLQIKQNLKVLAAQAGPEVRAALAGMDSDDALVILSNNLKGQVLYSGDPTDEFPRWQKLGRLGLVKVLTDRELREFDRKDGEKKGHYIFGVDPTDKYFKMYKFLSRAVFEIANGSVTADTQVPSERKP